MSKNDYSWVGMKLKHLDGRTGKVSKDSSGFGYRSLTIEVDGGAPESIQLNSFGPDSGATGWMFVYSPAGEPERWGLLGDHNHPRRVDEDATV